jgi:hypothetical protein
MIKGECLCGTVEFEATSIIAPFELCHCGRCRTSTGSAYAAIVRVAVQGFRFTSGKNRIRLFELPVVERPPGYRRFFCDNCGAPVPIPNPTGEWAGVPAGCLKTRRGMVVLFQHKLRHEGCEVRRGTKYAMRSDVIYE